MTEPDEALKYARRQTFPDRRTVAQAYRAGQAASADRIKALEEGVIELERKRVEYVRAKAARARKLRNLLKEADQ